MPSTRSIRVLLLLLVLPALAIALLAVSDEEKPILRIAHQGGAMLENYSQFELLESGRLVLTRYHSGGRDREIRIFQPDEPTKQRYWDLLEEGGYLNGPAEAFQSEVVQKRLGIWEDIPSWQVEVFRDGEPFARTVVPPEISGRLYPELNEVSYVRAAWALLDEFRPQWDRAARTARFRNRRHEPLVLCSAGDGASRQVLRGARRSPLRLSDSATTARRRTGRTLA